MVINLIKPKRMCSMTLPTKIKGRYWLTDTEEDRSARVLFSIEAVNGRWVVRSTESISVIDAENNVASSVVIEPLSFFNVRVRGSEERMILFAEGEDTGRGEFRKYIVRGRQDITIGRTNNNALHYANTYVSSLHARLTYDGERWHIADTNSKNGTYVNGLRIQKKALEAGDLIYIMGLRIVVGHGFLAVNDPGGLLTVNTPALEPYRPQKEDADRPRPALPEQPCFYRSARFHREVETAHIAIDPPPQVQKVETVPLALMLGPSLTMGLASLSTGILTVSNVIASGGDITQAVPTLVMSVSMLLGTVLWPILTKKHEKKMQRRGEDRRQERYLAYLDSVRDEIRRRCKEQTDILNENAASQEDCANRIAEEKPNLWERTIGQKDFLRLRLGVGNLPMNADIKCAEKKFTMEDDTLQDAMLSLGAETKELVNVPVSVALPGAGAVGLVGRHDDVNSLAKALILQMIALHSYDELKLILLADQQDGDEWDFVRCIPHFWSDDRQVRFLARDADELKELSVFMEKNILSRGDVQNREYSAVPPYYVVIAASEELTKRCDALQKLLRFKHNCGASAILLARQQRGLPKETNVVVTLDGRQAEMTFRDDTAGRAVAFTRDEINEAMLGNLARDIANIRLDTGTGQFQLPDMLSFLEMYGVGKVEHLNALSRWKENNPSSIAGAGGCKNKRRTLQAGSSRKIPRTPRSGGRHDRFRQKSEFIITYILSLALNFHPEEVAFILIDYKGGGLAGAFENMTRGIRLPHLAGTITNLDGAAVKRSLISIQSELRRRQAIFNEARISGEGTIDIYKYQKMYRARGQAVPHLFIISDEFAELKSQQPEFMEQLISAARIGRSLGIHLILATQKPSGVVDDQIWSNSRFRVCLKVQERSDSMDMIKRPDAAALAETGRFYLQVGFNELFAMGQSAWSGAPTGLLSAP